MIIVNIKGGLGNQMFQYAAGRCLANRLNAQLKLDTDFYAQCKNSSATSRDFQLDKLSLKVIIATKSEVDQIKYTQKNTFLRYFRKLSRYKQALSKNYFRENTPCFDHNFFRCVDGTYLDGYWQCEKYFLEIEKIIRTEFLPAERLSGINMELANQIRSVNSVCIHVRRGDYVSDAKTNAYHGICSLDYYKKAIEHITARVDNPSFFVFSDDINWVKKNLIVPYHHVLVNNGASQDYIDLRLMSLCKHHIIANSSFSWWGAWLGYHSGQIVIAPQKWFKAEQHETKDLLPSAWIKM